MFHATYQKGSAALEPSIFFEVEAVHIHLDSQGNLDYKKNYEIWTLKNVVSETIQVQLLLSIK